MLKAEGPLYSVILPTYNQRQNLPLVLYLLYETAVHHKINMQVIIVEDNSPDGTLAIAKRLVTLYQDMSIIVIEREGKLGLGSAYRTGLERCKGEFVIIMDADLSHHPKYIPLMIKKQIDLNADIVSSTRYVTHAGVEGWSFYRKLTSRTANFVTNLMLGSHSSDLTSSFRLYRRQVLEELMGATHTKGYSFQMQIMVRAEKGGKRVIEQPIVFVDRLYGKSKLGAGQIFLYLKGLMQLFIEY